MSASVEKTHAVQKIRTAEPSNHKSVLSHHRMGYEITVQRSTKELHDTLQERGMFLKKNRLEEETWTNPRFTQRRHVPKTVKKATDPSLTRQQDFQQGPRGSGQQRRPSASWAHRSPLMEENYENFKPHSDNRPHPYKPRGGRNHTQRSRGGRGKNRLM